MSRIERRVLLWLSVGLLWFLVLSIMILFSIESDVVVLPWVSVGLIYLVAFLRFLCQPEVAEEYEKRIMSKKKRTGVNLSVPSNLSAGLSVKLTLGELELLRTCVLKHKPTLLQLVDPVVLNNLTQEQGEALIDVVSEMFMLEGLREDCEPNELGIQLDNLIDAIQSLYIEELKHRKS